MKPLIGQPLPRKEDHRLLTGQGRFVDDLSSPNQAEICFLRSPHGHARITAVDVALAMKMPGIIAIFTGRDYVDDGLGPIVQNPIGVDHIDVSKPGFDPGVIPFGPLPQQMPITTDLVRHIGEVVAVIVAETLAAALDAAECIEVAYELLPAVTDARAALAEGAPLLFPGRGSNLCITAENGDRAAVESALASAHRVIRLESWNQRIYGAPIEPRGALAAYDPATGRYTLHSTSQGVHRQKNALMALFGVTADQVHVVSGDVGGGFGVRSSCYPEYPLLLWAARRTGRPVKWLASRQELFVSDYQARDCFAKGALALDREGRFLALQLDYTNNLGAYPLTFSTLTNLLHMAAGVYDIPALHVTVRGVVTNTVPMTVLRGAGRPESNFIMERLVDLAAAELALDRVEIRRRNLIPATSLPYQSPLGALYDSGEFAENMASALRLIEWDGFPARKAAARVRGRLLGIGIANYLESPTGFPRERTDIRVLPEGRVDAVIGTQSTGQGHETSFAQVVGSVLQIPLDQVAILFGDSDIAVSGSGSHSDRSMRLGGTILVRASDAIVAQGRRLAAYGLEAAEADITYEDGIFTVAGTDRALGLFEVAAIGLAPETPEALRGALAATSEIAQRLPAHPNGCVACEVEVDPETGTVRLLRYVAVDDVGIIINPLIVHGQIHGGIALGVGQALLEHCVYEPGSGQLLSGSFLDYCLPRADDVPSFLVAPNEVPAASNPLGVKGAGEAGTTPAASVVINAIVDALRDRGVRHLEMPATSERIWRALRPRSEEAV